MPEKFDLCVIGCGPGGFAAAMRALDFGKHVCVVEKAEIGGAGVMHGAMTSKTLWELAKDFAGAAAVDRGYRAAGLSVDFSSVRNTVIQAGKEKQYQMLSQFETFSPRRWNGPGSITLRYGTARFKNKNTVELIGIDDEIRTIEAAHFLIATGSKPRKFPGIEVDHHRIIDSDGILGLEKFPRRLLIVGAGIIGCEYATVFSNFQKTKVHLLDKMDRVIPYEDDDVSGFVSDNLKKHGVEIHHKAILRDIKKRPDFLEAYIDYEDGHSEVLEVDCVLMSIGRVPNAASLNLQQIGIMPNERGFLEVDENNRVAGSENIWAAGDVTPNAALVNVSEMEGRHAVSAMFDKKPPPLQYGNLCTIMFFHPEVAAVGLNEKQCRQANIPYRVAWCSNALLSRAIAMRSLDGFVKILVSNDSSGKILGMRSAGPQASSNIMSIVLMIDQQKGILDVLQAKYPHPSISEGIQECLRLLCGESIFKSQAFPQFMKISTWQPGDSAGDVSAQNF